MHEYNLFKIIHHALILNIQLFSNNNSVISVKENISIRKAVLIFFPSYIKDVHVSLCIPPSQQQPSILILLFHLVLLNTFQQPRKIAHTLH